MSNRSTLAGQGQLVNARDKGQSMKEVRIVPVEIQCKFESSDNVRTQSL